VADSESEEAVVGFVVAVCDGPLLKPPFADEGLAARFDLFARCRDTDLFMQTLGASARR
jgi:hypothetical protein